MSGAGGGGNSDGRAGGMSGLKEKRRSRKGIGDVCVESESRGKADCSEGLPVLERK